MAASTLADLIGEISPGTKSNLLGNPGGGGIGLGGGTGPVINVPVTTGGGTTTGTTTTGATTTGGIFSCSSFSIWNPFCWGQIGSQASACVGDFLLRIGLFILGLMAIAGAIYLYKGSGVLALPSKVVRGTIKATAHAAKAVAQSDE